MLANEINSVHILHAMWEPRASISRSYLWPWGIYDMGVYMGLSP